MIAKKGFASYAYLHQEILLYYLVVIYVCVTHAPRNGADSPVNALSAE